MKEWKKLQAIKIWIEWGMRREGVEKEGRRGVILVDGDGWWEKERWGTVTWGSGKRGQVRCALNDDGREKEREGCGCFFLFII